MGKDDAKKTDNRSKVCHLVFISYLLLTSSCQRLSTDEIEQGGEVPLIPSLPISPMTVIGPGPGILNLTYNVSKTLLMPIDVEFVTFVILGNHRDAWTFGAVARRLGKMQKSGWRPRQTIILCNWDAEEYGLRNALASRDVAYLNMDCAVSGPGFQASQLLEAWRNYSKKLAKIVVNFFQFDNISLFLKVPDRIIPKRYMILGPGSKGSPYARLQQLTRLLKIIIPIWFGRLGGGGSDYAPFVQHVGVYSIDMLFGGGILPLLLFHIFQTARRDKITSEWRMLQMRGIRHHSMYDDFTWMRKFGDPMFQRHVAGVRVASNSGYSLLLNMKQPLIWGLVALRLADDEFLPLTISLMQTNFVYVQAQKELEDQILGKSVSLLPLYEINQELKKVSSLKSINKK
ncbi:hypothetical protein MKW92_012292, partial [Papaver armeniacum]